MDPSSLPSTVVDKRIEQLSKSINRVYGSWWGIMWRNFLSGFMHSLGGLVAYLIFIFVIITIIQKTGVLKPLETAWQQLTNNLINDVQKNIQQNLGPLNKIQIDQQRLNELPQIKPMNELFPPQMQPPSPVPTNTVQ